MRISDWSSDVCFSDLVRYIGWEGDQAAIATLAPGDIAVLENTRFFSGEEKNDPKVVDRFAAIGDFYVNDAFSAAHRAHASTEGLAHRLPAFAGRAMETELATLEKATGNPEHPVAAVVGDRKSTEARRVGTGGVSTGRSRGWRSQ